MFRVLTVAVLLVAGLLAAAPISAAGQETSVSQESTDELLRRIAGLLEDKRFGEALSQSLQWEKVAPDDIARAMAKTMYGGALLGLKRTSEAQLVFNEADALAPREPAVRRLQLSLAQWYHESDLGLAMLDRMIQRGAEAFQGIDPRTVYGILDDAPPSQSAKNQDRKIKLARLRFASDYGDSATVKAVEVLFERGALKEAAELLRMVDEPDKIENFLILRKYSALWPALEAMAGPGLSKVIRSNIESSAKEYEANPESWLLFTNYAEALRLGGRARDAAALHAELPASKEDIQQVDELAGWAMNNIAYALRDDGRLDEADRLFASLNEADIPNAGWRVNMIINRLGFLVDSGQFARAAPLLDGAEEAAKVNGNPYSRQLVRTFRYCIYRRTGRHDEAKAIRSEMLKHADDARTATIDQLICVGELDEAETLALKGLADEGFQSSLVWKLQRKPLSSNDNNAWSAGWAALRRRPAIAKEFDRLGRDLPDHLLPKSTSGGVTSGMLR
jgi:tetratricopeptide (TPR) repeat protein